LQEFRHTSILSKVVNYAHKVLWHLDLVAFAGSVAALTNVGKMTPIIKIYKMLEESENAMVGFVIQHHKVVRLNDDRFHFSVSNRE